MTTYDIYYFTKKSDIGMGQTVKAKDINAARVAAISHFDTKKYDEAHILPQGIHHRSTAAYLVFSDGSFYWIKKSETKDRYEIYTLDIRNGRLIKKVAAGKLSTRRR